MDQKTRGRCIGMVGTLVVHVIIIVLLLLICWVIPVPDEESGMEVMMGNTESAYGNFDPATLVDVDILSDPQATEIIPELPEEQEMLTQDVEESVVITPANKPKKEKKEEKKKPEKTEAEKAAEMRRLAEAKAERERRAAAEATAQRVSGAFGKGEQMGDKGTGTGHGIEGSPTGNSSTGAKTGTGRGYGTFDLGGRSIGAGGLPRPVYDVQDEGRVVVAITVNPEGAVIATGISRLTNTVNPTLRKAAEDAAKKARFNQVEGLNNQTGTITYYFNLR